MKKISLLALAFAVSTLVFAQKSNVQNAFRALEKGNIAEAIEYIEKAAVNSSTANDVKMYDYRGKIYFEVHSNADHTHLDAMAAFKCAESWEAVAKHPKAKKWFDKEDINTKITNAGVALFNKATELYNAGNNQLALDHYNKIFDLFPLDEKGNLSRNNITKEEVWFRSSLVATNLNDYNLAKNYLQKLIDINYQEPQIYSNMAKIFQEEGSLEKSLEYILLGREMFEFDLGLIFDELNYYLENNKQVEAQNLINLAIEEDPNNDGLYAVLGNTYNAREEYDKAIESYLEALSINPENKDAIYNLSIVSNNKVARLDELIDKAGTNWSKVDELKKEKFSFVSEAIIYIEKAILTFPEDYNLLEIIKPFYYLNDNMDKYNDVSKKLNNK